MPLRLSHSGLGVTLMMSIGGGETTSVRHPKESAPAVLL